MKTKTKIEQEVLKEVKKEALVGLHQDDGSIELCRGVGKMKNTGTYYHIFDVEKAISLTQTKVQKDISIKLGEAYVKGLKDGKGLGKTKTLQQVEEVLDDIECSAQDNAIWFKERLKTKLKNLQK